MRASIILLATMACISRVPAQTPEDGDAAASLALHAAAARHATLSATRTEPSPDVTRPLTAEQAVQVAKSKRCPILVRVGNLDCSSLCASLRPEIPTAHVAEICGDTSPHLRLIEADSTGQLWRSAERWTALPTEAEVRIAAHKLDKYVGAMGKPVPPALVPKTAVPNAGHCSCGDDRCFCLPASKCPGGCPAAQTPVPSTTYALPPPSGCPTCPGGGGTCPTYPQRRRPFGG
jgi:hypothetical protein